MADVAVLDAQNRVRAGASAGALLQEAAAAVKRRRHATLHVVARAPGLAEALRLPLAAVGRAVPQHLLRPAQREGHSVHVSGFLLTPGGHCSGLSPCAVAEDVSAVKRVDGNAVLDSALVEDGVPAVEQNLVLMKREEE